IHLYFDPPTTNWYIDFQQINNRNQCGPIRYVLPELSYSPCNPNTFALDQGGATCAQVPPTVTVTPLSDRIAVECCHNCDTPLDQALPRRLFFTATSQDFPGCFDPILNVPIPLDIRDGQGCFQCDCLKWQNDPFNMVRLNGNNWLFIQVGCGD